MLTEPADVQTMFDNIPVADKKLAWIHGTTARWDGYLEFQRRPEPILDWFAKHMNSAGRALTALSHAGACHSVMRAPGYPGSGAAVGRVGCNPVHQRQEQAGQFTPAASQAVVDAGRYDRIGLARRW